MLTCTMCQLALGSQWPWHRSQVLLPGRGETMRTERFTEPGKNLHIQPNGARAPMSELAEGQRGSLYLLRSVKPLLWFFIQDSLNVGKHQRSSWMSRDGQLQNLCSSSRGNNELWRIWRASTLEHINNGVHTSFMLTPAHLSYPNKGFILEEHLEPSKRNLL